MSLLVRSNDLMSVAVAVKKIDEPRGWNRCSNQTVTHGVLNLTIPASLTASLAPSAPESHPAYIRVTSTSSPATPPTPAPIRPSLPLFLSTAAPPGPRPQPELLLQTAPCGTRLSPTFAAFTWTSLALSPLFHFSPDPLRLRY
ncbi:hypothetical protein NDU88_005220 [Pleurodeles waltl]|uniref:Uncharacterized protein n=1 Tax=Pleurodeles waltl TaxID=8319 RepID=A0AAV7UIY5_PLEWA|nr:hypothetical protein NDU88_005220 [Pleurodeles waltl]